MKTAFLTAYLVATISFVSHGQTLNLPAPEPSVLECTYRLTFQPDSFSKATGTDIQRLWIGRNLSKFESESFYLHDSLVAMTPPVTQETAQIFVDKVVSLPRVTATYTFYKTATTGRLYCYDRVGLILYTYKEPDNLFKWTILTDTARIAGYSCQRATAPFAGRSFEAWFTRQIPVPEGPYKFYGLPGLIVKVSDMRQHYVYELIKLTKSKRPQQIALPLVPALLTTKKELRQGKLADKALILDRLAAMGNTVTVADRQAAKERAAKSNNPLELKL